jgi:hypothetical protein
MTDRPDIAFVGEPSSEIRYVFLTFKKYGNERKTNILTDSKNFTTSIESNSSIDVSTLCCYREAVGAQKKRLQTYLQHENLPPKDRP